jgi:hypothetical protein
MYDVTHPKGKQTTLAGVVGRVTTGSAEFCLVGSGGGLERAGFSVGLQQRRRVCVGSLRGQAERRQTPLEERRRWKVRFKSNATHWIFLMTATKDVAEKADLAIPTFVVKL